MPAQGSPGHAYRSQSSHIRIPVYLLQCLDDPPALLLAEHTQHALIVDVREGCLEHGLGFHDAAIADI